VLSLCIILLQRNILFCLEQKHFSRLEFQNGARWTGKYIFNRFVAGKTLYQNVKSIAGHVMTIHEDGKTLSKKWWDLKRNSKPT
jgi:hypothetical protein